MIQFNKMTGYEFEDYIAKMFRKMGFRVVQTNYSGDGGIDMLLFFERPVFKGKYIVQCKNCTGLVGQPEIRDLYGVVMSESANKGIIITTSDYTEQAYSFANGKNLELINRSILIKILSELNIVNCPIEDDIEQEHFTNYTEFNNIRFDYLREKIDKQPSVPINYEEMIDFLRSYIVKGDYNIYNAGLIDLLHDYLHQCKERCYKAKSNTTERLLCSSIETEIMIAMGELSEATKQLIEMGNSRKYYYIDLNDISLSLLYNNYLGQANKTSKKNHLNSALKFNLLSAYRNIGFDRGVKSIMTYFPTVDSIDEFITQYKHSYLEREGGTLCVDENFLNYLTSLFSVYQAFISGQLDDVFLFVKQTVYKAKNSGRYKKNREESFILQTIDGVGTTQFMINHNYKKTKAKIIEELNEMFDALGL